MASVYKFAKKGHIARVKFSPDNQKIFMIFGNGDVSLWLLPPKNLTAPQTLKHQVYAAIIANFQKSSYSQDFVGYTSFLRFLKGSGDKGKHDLLAQEKVVFDTFDEHTQKYLRHLIPQGLKKFPENEQASRCIIN